MKGYYLKAEEDASIGWKFIDAWENRPKSENNCWTQILELAETLLDPSILQVDLKCKVELRNDNGLLTVFPQIHTIQGLPTCEWVPKNLEVWLKIKVVNQAN